MAESEHDPYSIEEIIREAKKRVGKYEERNDRYEACRSAYFGHRDTEAARRGMDATGRPLMQMERTREELLNRGGAPNLLTPIVDDYTFLRGTVPTMKVLPEDEGEPAKEEATKRSRIIRAMWANSNMDLQQMQAGFYLSCLGDFAYILTPLLPKDSDSLRPAGIYIEVVDPSTCYPRFRTGWAQDELDDLFIVNMMDGQVAEAQYNIECDKSQVMSIHYLSRTHSTLIVDDNKVAEVKHDLGFCPAQWVKNKMSGPDVFGQSDIAHVLELHRELQVMSLVMGDSLIEATYSQLVVKDPVNVTEQFEVGPGAKPIVVQSTGGVDRLQPANPPSAAEMLIGRTWENIQHMTGSAPVRTESKIEGSNISARAIHAVQGPMETRLAGTQTMLGFAIEKLNAKILLMLHKIPEFKKAELSVWGQDKGQPFSVNFNGEELGGWYRNAVEFGAMIGSTTHEKAVVGLQLHGQGMVPKEWVLEQVGVEDPQMLIKEAKAEQQEMQQQAQAQQQPPGQQPGQPPDPAQVQQQAMQPAQQGESLAAGGPPPGPPGQASQGGSPPPAGEGAPPPTQAPPDFPPMDGNPSAPPATPGPMADLAGPFTQIIQQITPQLKGQILGAVPTPEGVAVTITDYRDKVIVRKAFKQFGSVKVNVVSQAAA